MTERKDECGGLQAGEVPELAEGDIDDLKALYSSIKSDIEAKMDDFQKVWTEATEEQLYAELAFCIFTPQSKATACWATVDELLEDGILMSGTEGELSERLRKVRFRYTEAKNLIALREEFLVDGKPKVRDKLLEFGDARQVREWLVSAIKGMGYKEASHFLRNIGIGEELGILDRHIMSSLVEYEAIPEIPTTLTTKRYLEIELRMTEFSKKMEIPMGHLDLLLWYKKTGFMFK